MTCKELFKTPCGVGGVGLGFGGDVMGAQKKLNMYVIS